MCVNVYIWATWRTVTSTITTTTTELRTKYKLKTWMRAGAYSQITWLGQAGRAKHTTPTDASHFTGCIHVCACPFASVLVCLCVCVCWWGRLLCGRRESFLTFKIIWHTFVRRCSCYRNELPVYLSIRASVCPAVRPSFGLSGWVCICMCGWVGVLLAFKYWSNNARNVVNAAQCECGSLSLFLSVSFGLYVCVSVSVCFA